MLQNATNTDVEPIAGNSLSTTDNSCRDRAKKKTPDDNTEGVLDTLHDLKEML
ncbi:MAG: hypothetical protein ACRBF0_15285 [Calditrichia bacterium]